MNKKDFFIVGLGVCIAFLVVGITGLQIENLELEEKSPEAYDELLAKYKFISDEFNFVTENLENCTLK